ncbi:MAG: aldehyde dehydrogenase [Phycisphaerales bacterium]|nr:aldehyde dehydrogenase [Phycisphaerales bacterium]
MLHIPILRHGVPYRSAETVEIVHHATGEPVAALSQANAGLVTRDLHRWPADCLERFSVAELIAITRKAAELFIDADLPVGDEDGEPVRQSFDEYIRLLSATTGSPVTYCRNNAKRVQRVMADVGSVIAGLTRGVDLSILDRGYGVDDGRMMSFYRAGRVFGAVLPSNSPGVHSLWIPAFALKAPIVLKPGREEPWTPARLIAAFVAAGAPREAFGFYPTDHAGAGEILRCADRAMIFGDESTTRRYAHDPRIEIHGPGFSKVVLGPDAAEQWESHIDLIASSIAANSGRSCINASAVWTPAHGREIAAALADRLSKTEARPSDDPRAELAAFANAAFAERISQVIDAGLRTPGAVDLCEQKRGTPRLVRKGRVAYLLPSIVWIESAPGDGIEPTLPAWEHPLANREFLFPYASVIECPVERIPRAIGQTLVVSAITEHQPLIQALMAAPNVDRLNVGAIPTWQISWDQPHEGNMFEFLYKRRSIDCA